MYMNLSIQPINQLIHSIYPSIHPIPHSIHAPSLFLFLCYMNFEEEDEMNERKGKNKY